MTKNIEIIDLTLTAELEDLPRDESHMELIETSYTTDAFNFLISPIDCHENSIINYITDNEDMYVNCKCSLCGNYLSTDLIRSHSITGFREKEFFDRRLCYHCNERLRDEYTIVHLSNPQLSYREFIGLKFEDTIIRKLNEHYKE